MSLTGYRSGAGIIAVCCADLLRGRHTHTAKRNCLKEEEGEEEDLFVLGYFRFRVKSGRRKRRGRKKKARKGEIEEERKRRGRTGGEEEERRRR